MIAGNPSLAWYLLFRIPGLGVRKLNSIHECLTRAGLSLEAALYFDWPEFQRIVPQVPRSVFESLRANGESKEHHEYEQLHDRGVHIIHREHPDYPSALGERLSRDAPPVLFCQGYLGLLPTTGVAIVGSRHASPEGLQFASQVAGQLALAGSNVISGYAAGVDTAAHLGALANDGTTTMVLSEGILHFRRKREFREITWDGNVLAISQFQPREKWMARHAMVRNKLVCGLSSAVIVVESGERVDSRGRMSGTFNAAETALAMGLPLFVLDPGIVSGASGNADLVRLGGRVVRPDSACDMIVSALNDPRDPYAQIVGVVEQGRLF